MYTFVVVVVKILSYLLDDPYSRLSPGEQGTVNLVDDTGTVFVDWDCGSHLGVVYGIDRIRKL